MANYIYFDYRHFYVLCSMWPFKYALFVLPLNYVLSVLSFVVDESRFLGFMLLLLNLLTFAIGSKIVYERYQQIHVLNLLTTRPELTAFANHVSSFFAGSIFLGYIFTLYLSMFKINDYITTAVYIFSCFGGTVYMWLQCVVTVHAATLYYDKALLQLRQTLAIISVVIIMSMAISGCIAVVLPSKGYLTEVILSYCAFTVSSGNFLCTALLYVFLLSFEKDCDFIGREYSTNFQDAQQEECEECNITLDIPLETIKMIPINRTKTTAGISRHTKVS